MYEKLPFHSRKLGRQGSSLGNGKNGSGLCLRSLLCCLDCFLTFEGTILSALVYWNSQKGEAAVAHQGRVAPTAESDDLCKPTGKELVLWQHFLSNERLGRLCDYTHALLGAARTLHRTPKKPRSNASLSISCFPAETGSISDQSTV